MRTNGYRFRIDPPYPPTGSHVVLDGHRGGKHFCETCRTLQPPTRKKPIKGWKCAECSAKS